MHNNTKKELILCLCFLKGTNYCQKSSVCDNIDSSKVDANQVKILTMDKFLCKGVVQCFISSSVAETLSIKQKVVKTTYVTACSAYLPSTLFPFKE